MYPNLKPALLPSLIFICSAACYAQTCYYAIDAASLKTALQQAVSGDFVIATGDIDLDPLISTNDLPITIPAGVTLTGTYELVPGSYSKQERDVQLSLLHRMAP